MRNNKPASRASIKSRSWRIKYLSSATSLTRLKCRTRTWGEQRRKQTKLQICVNVNSKKYKSSLKNQRCSLMSLTKKWLTKITKSIQQTKTFPSHKRKSGICFQNLTNATSSNSWTTWNMANVFRTKKTLFSKLRNCNQPWSILRMNFYKSR